MPTFIHIGDVHLQATSPRNPDRLEALDQIIGENVSRENLGAWLIPGDLFHAKSAIEDRNALALRLARMAAVAPVVLVRGNHDAHGDLEIFARLKATWPIYVMTRPGVLQVPLPTGDVAAIAGLPYPEKGTLVGAHVAPGDIVQTAGALLDVIFMQLAHDLEVPRVSGAIPIFIGHVNVKGSVASTGQPQIGLEQEIDVAMLERLPVVYCGLSHIHKSQEIGRAVYAGSIAAMDHGETEAKAYVEIETTRWPDGAWSAGWSRRAIATPRMFHVEGRLNREGFRLADGSDSEVERRYHAGDWTGTDTRVRYTFNASERAVLSEDTVRGLFHGALRLKLEGIAEPDRELRAPEVAAARTLPEKLAAYRKESQLSSGVAVKVALLEHQDVTTILVRVAEQLRAIESPEKVEVAA